MLPQSRALPGGDHAGQSPKERMNRSGRTNHKRAYWLRGKIIKWVRDLAFPKDLDSREKPSVHVANVPAWAHTWGSETVIILSVHSQRTRIMQVRILWA